MSEYKYKTKSSPVFRDANGVRRRTVTIERDREAEAKLPLAVAEPARAPAPEAHDAESSKRRR